MSGRRVGNRREDVVADALATLGYATAVMRGSGSAGVKQAARPRRIVGDVLAIREGGPNLQVEVGGRGKRLRTAFGELRAGLVASFAPVVVRFLGRGRWKIYTDEHTAHGGWGDALEAIREAS